MWTTNIASYNLMLSVPEPIRFNGQTQRLERLPAGMTKLSQETPGGLDVIICQELIPSTYHTMLTQAMADRGWTYASDPLASSYSSNLFKLVNGGVVVFSKYPILDQRQFVFDTDCQFSDCMAAKGVVYCRILLPDQNVINVLSTHFQAWHTPRAQRVRQLQAQRFFDFVQSLQIAPDEAVVFLGDLNIDFYTSQQELTGIMRTLHMDLNSFKAYPGKKFSSDPNTNALMGNDEDVMYATKFYPQGCYEDYLNTLNCPCCPQEMLDYAGYSTDHLKPVQASFQVHPLKYDDYFTVKMNSTTERKIKDLSDHYPIVASYQFPQATQFAERSINPRSLKPRGKINWVVVVLTALIVSFFVVLGAVLLRLVKKVF